MTESDVPAVVEQEPVQETDAPKVIVAADLVETVDEAEAKPISGDVGEALNATQAKQKREAMEQMRAAHMKAINEIVALLPEGSRPAQPAELEGRKLPPQALPMVIPKDKTIAKDLLERCIKVGIFPVPAPGVAMLDILTPEDREELNKVKEGHMAQMKQKQAHMQHSHSIRNNLLNRGVNPNAPTLPQEIDVDQFPRGKSGLPIPPVDGWKDKTLIEWNDTEHMNEIRQSLDGASFIEATKWLLIGCSSSFTASAVGAFLLRSNTAYCICYVASVLVALLVFIKFQVRPKAAGYQCPSDYLEIPQKGKTAVITGGAASTGGEIVKQLFRMGADKIIVVERSYMIGLQLLSDLKKQVDSEGWDTSEWNEVVECQARDLSEPAEVLAFTEDLVRNRVGIDYLILNNSEFFPEPTSDVHVLDKHFTANYLGHFLMVKNLMNCRDGLIAKSARIITTGAQFYAVPEQLDLHATVLDDENIIKPTTSFFASKALGLLNTKMVSQRMDTAIASKKKRQQELNIQLPPDHKEETPIAVAFNPGVVLDTTTKRLLKSGNPFIAPFASFFFRLVGKSPWDSAQSAFKCMFAPNQLLVKGAYYNEGAYQKTFCGTNVTKQEVKHNIVKLWQMSSTMTYEHSFDKKAIQHIAATGMQSPSSQTSSMSVPSESS